MLKAAQMAVGAPGEHRGQALTQSPEALGPMLALMALLLLAVSPSFCPLRTTAALLSRGTWLRISRRSLGTCS